MNAVGFSLDFITPPVLKILYQRPPVVNRGSLSSIDKDKKRGRISRMEIKSAVEIRNLSKKYDSFTAVANLSLSIMEGEIFGLLGPNGAGKTTTVKILCQLLRESSGEVIVHGIRIPDRRILSMIGYMPQDLALYPEITIEQTLEFFASLHLMEREDASRRIEELTKFVSLYERRKEMISRLSGGMKRRVSLIASMIHNPKILILDEPTVGVDPESVILSGSIFSS